MRICLYFSGRDLFNELLIALTLFDPSYDLPTVKKRVQFVDRAKILKELMHLCAVSHCQHSVIKVGQFLHFALSKMSVFNVIHLDTLYLKSRYNSHDVIPNDLAIAHIDRDKDRSKGEHSKNAQE